MGCEVSSAAQIAIFGSARIQTTSWSKLRHQARWQLHIRCRPREHLPGKSRTVLTVIYGLPNYSVTKSRAVPRWGALPNSPCQQQMRNRMVSRQVRMATSGSPNNKETKSVISSHRYLKYVTVHNRYGADVSGRETPMPITTLDS